MSRFHVDVAFDLTTDAAQDIAVFRRVLRRTLDDVAAARAGAVVAGTAFIDVRLVEGHAVERAVDPVDRDHLLCYPACRPCPDDGLCLNVSGHYLRNHRDQEST